MKPAADFDTPSPAAWLLSAAAHAAGVAAELVEAAREDDPAGVIYQGDEIVERLTDALKLLLEAAPASAEPDTDVEYDAAKDELHAACAKFLEGWA